MLLPSSGFETKETLKELFKVDAYLQDYFAFPSPPNSAMRSGDTVTSDRIERCCYC